MVTDVFSALVGQETSVRALREYARHPVHAYLISGPSGAPVAETARRLAAALQCPEHGCGTCATCRRVLEGNESDVYVAQRAGASWSVEDIHEIERVARRRPLSAPFNIVVLEDVELTVSAGSPSAPALLKTLEEPATKTIFILTAEELPEELVTIESRCVALPLQGLSVDEITQVLVRDGAPDEVARSAAEASAGNLRRAMVLVNDPSLAQRLALWRQAPDRFNGTASSVAAIVTDVMEAISAAQAPLVALQEVELERLSVEAKAMGLRSVPGRTKLEQQHKREQRRFRLDELRFGVSVLTGVYRQRLHVLVSSGGADRHALQQTVTAIDILTEVYPRLATTVDEGVLLHDLLLSLIRL